jgi:ribulose-5-phosphate 4-epimerase/fuculose-1-phosphate aldolase
MHCQLEHYIQLLLDEQSVKTGQIAISAQNDAIYSCGNQTFISLAQDILQRLDCAAVIVAEPLQPFPAFLLHRSKPDAGPLVPRDSESRSSLHDIPLIRHDQDRATLLNNICSALNKRKGCIVEGIGIISQGSLTVEQAYIAWSSLSHATTIKYFEDLLSTGPLLPDEAQAVRQYKNVYLKPLDLAHYSLSPLLPTHPQELLHEISMLGQATVELGLVDSFFGNISCLLNKTLYISQTSARLDELSSQVDSVPFDRLSTTGITASSELPAHRAVVLATGCRIVLHGHPRFPVIMSFFADSDTNKAFDLIDSILVVGGEGGVGGLAENLSKAFCLTDTKAVIVRGHGAFVVSTTGCGEALACLADVEQHCRDIYFTRLRERYQI